MTKKQAAKLDSLLTQIAVQHLHVETLETRNRDRLDFYDVPVWAMRAALEAAYEEGRKAAQRERATGPDPLSEALNSGDGSYRP